MAKKKRVSATRHEVLDDTPVAIPLKFRRVESQADRMRRIIREEMSRAAQDNGFESFEESDDFAIDDEYDPRSPYEMSIDQELEGYGSRDQGGSEGTSGAAGQGSGETEESLQPSGEAPAGGGAGEAPGASGAG